MPVACYMECEEEAVCATGCATPLCALCTIDLEHECAAPAAARELPAELPAEPADPDIRPMIPGAYKGRLVLPGVWVKEPWDNGPGARPLAVVRGINDGITKAELSAEED